MLNKWGQLPKKFHQNVLNDNDNSTKGNSLISASSSRMFANYEISDDLTRVYVQYLERKYGGRLRAHASATKIQRFYRHYRLCQQWHLVLKLAPNSARCRNQQEVVVEANYTPKYLDRNAHIRKLAQSQPSLKYQPTTSLRAQLRAERRDITFSPSHSPQSDVDFSKEKSSAANTSMVFVESPLSDNPKLIPVLKPLNQAKQRPYIELMSPRLSQRRIVSSIYQPKIESSNSIKNSEQQIAPTTILLYDSDHDEFNKDGETKKSTLSINTASDFVGGYHCSASPHLHCIFADGGNNNCSTSFSSESSEATQRNVTANNNNNGATSSKVTNAVGCGARVENALNKQNLQTLNSPTRTIWMQRTVGTIGGGGSHRNDSLPQIFAATSTGTWSPHSEKNEAMPSQLSTFHPSPHYNFMQQRPSTATTALGFNAYNTGSLPRMDNKRTDFGKSEKNCLSVEQHAVCYSAAASSSLGVVSRSTGRSASSGRNVSTATFATPPVVSQHELNARNPAKHQYHLQKVQKNQHSSQQQQRPPIPSQMRGWTEQQRRRLYRIGLNFFNKKPDRGLQLLINWGYVHENPQAIARFFLDRRGLSKQMIGEFLGTIKSPFHSAILESFVNEIPMYGMDIDMALRQLLTNFRLPGEAQKIDHIMQVFARRYRSCNPDQLPPHISSDTIYILAFAIIMLNTDLHTPSLKESKRMKLEEFVKNILGIEEGQHLDKKMLQGIFERVKEFEFRAGSDHVTQVMKVDQSIVGKEKPKLVEPHRRLICYCRLHQVIDSNKKQTATAHQREVYLFNDLMLIGKLFSKKKTVAQHTLRYWTSLIGLRVEAFQNLFYNYGLVISCPDGQEFIFNAKNDDDRFHFMADLRESVAEATEMEQLRIELELDKQNGGGKSCLGSNWFAANCGNGAVIEFKPDSNTAATAQRDSGLPDIDQPSISSSASCTPQQMQQCGSAATTTIDDEEYGEDGAETKMESSPFDRHNLNSGASTEIIASEISPNEVNFKCFTRIDSHFKGIVMNGSNSSTGSSSTLPSSLVTFDSSNSVASSSSAGFAENNNVQFNGDAVGKNSATISLRKTAADSNGNTHGLPFPTLTNVSTVNVNSGMNSVCNGASGGGLVVGGGGGVARVSRRLSFNSLDSGMVEEGVDYSV